MKSFNLKSHLNFDEMCEYINEWKNELTNKNQST